MTPFTRWTLGLAVSLVVGGIVARIVLAVLRAYTRTHKDPQAEDEATRPVPPWVTGVVERGFFTVLVAWNISGSPIAMIAWLALKMATNWNRPGTPAHDVAWIRGAFVSLLAGVVSMFFALAGGVIARGGP